MVCSVVPEVFTDYSRPSAELTLVRLFQVCIANFIRLVMKKRTALYNCKKSIIH